jgi:hypothetical protein
VEAVQPFEITLSSAEGTCAFVDEQLVPQVTGGTSFAMVNNASHPLTVVYPGIPIVWFMPYIFCWYTPTNPLVCDYTFLQLDVLPGVYTLVVTDAHGCTANATTTVRTAPAIQVRVAGFTAVCQSSNSSTVFLNVTGGIPPYRVIENVTVITSNQSIGIEFVSTFNTTHCFHVIDSSNCILPTRVCFTLPNPGPVNLTITETDSCRNTATGSVRVTSDQDIQCSWFVTGGTQPLISSCTLTNLPPSAQLFVTATTIIGCTATATTQIGVRPQVVLTILNRTLNGVLNGPCVDTITATVSGGSLGAPFLLSLFNDPTHACMTVDYGTGPIVVVPCLPFVMVGGNMSNVTNATNVTTTNNMTGNMTINPNATGIIVITGVCRSYLYTIVAIEKDHTCAVSAVSTDSSFSFGAGGIGVVLLGLGPPDPTFPMPVNPFFKAYEPEGFTWTEVGWMVGLFCLVMTLVAYMLFSTARPGRGPPGTGKGLKKAV